MKLIISIFVGIIGGLVLGIALSSMIGIFGIVFLNQPIGIKYLPFYTAILCAVVVPIWNNKVKTVKHS
ncbi:DUF5957 family protein [Lederbergia panacisoli]|uniref:DUF5957 family protein n=1 Tax=Lederbergia panacisoli TaxID=1255251 RepID=UPI00214CBA3B|nr:DUF5957 family protein [Lederbergia panacisoli]MCR2822295.1 DUF5957 family protein [Lederbergia panacisoli]